MRGRAHSAAVGAILVLSAMVATIGPMESCRADITFELTSLTSNPPWNWMWPYGINSRGAVVGSGTYSTGGSSAWVSGYGGLTTPPGASTAYDISNRGEVVGAMIAPGGTSRASYWSLEGGGYVQRNLSLLGGSTSQPSEAYGINGSRQIVGYMQVGTQGQNHAVLWSSPTANPQDLGVLAGGDPLGWTSVAEDINGAGQVVGVSWRDGPALHAFLWSASGGMEDLGSIGAWYWNTYAMAINDHEEVVGYQEDGNYAWKWTRAAGMQSLGKPAGFSYSKPYDINNDGLIVGWACSSVERGWIYMNGQVKLLDDLLAAGYPGWHIEEAHAINEAWWIAARATDPAGRTHAILLTPTTQANPLGGGNFGSAPGQLPAGWTPSGPGTATTVLDPADPDNVCARLTTGSPVVLSTSVDTPGGPFYVVFDFQFATTSGTLDVLVDGTSIGTLNAPNPTTGTWDTAQMLVDDAPLMGLAGAVLAFELDGPAGSQVLLDNIMILAITPEPATLALLAAGGVGLLARRRK